ncbi:MAG: DedA family protein [Chloroflexi bacterium]|uniref:VTT domain-containing protein n=2 Tax=Candidatus Thermofonsia Clade 3 TaxID=2364209 RepID=A0A2M8QDB9_9CHLR|nr:MAG: hypothetical protein CUN48_06880 [Candidatus Thermofonsia Clade 3 bacterium]RMG64613.1 MAG: DedA family protein [Chloroflexota bacterium]
MWTQLHSIGERIFHWRRTSASEQAAGETPMDTTAERVLKNRDRAVVMFIVAIAISVAVLLLSTRFRDVLIAFGQLGLVGLFILSAVGNATVIIPAPAFVVACAAAPIYGVLHTGLIAGAGSAVGEMTGYMAGYGGTAVLPQGERYQRLHDLTERFGPVVVFLLALLPNPLFDLGGLAAGALKMHPLAFLFATFSGKAVRFMLIALACRGGLPFLTGLFDPNAP